MRKIIDHLSILAIVTSSVAIALVYAQTHASPEIKPTKEENFPLCKPLIINFEAGANEGFTRLSEQEKLEQYRDWLLWNVILGSGFSAQEINQNVSNLPTVRNSYINSIANFQYGTTRSLHIGNERIVALVPKAISRTERMNNLALIVEYYQNQGTQTQVVELFEYEISERKQFALLTWYKDFDIKEISGSVNNNENKSDSLKAFQKYIDDLGNVKLTWINNSISISPKFQINSWKFPRIPLGDVAATKFDYLIGFPRFSRHKTKPVTVPISKPRSIPDIDVPSIPTKNQPETLPSRIVSPSSQTRKPIFNSLRLSPITFQVDTFLEGTTIGTLNIDRTLNGFRIGFLGRDIDTENSFKSSLETNNQPIETVLKNSENVEIVMKSNTQQPNYIVKLSNSQRWLRISKPSQFQRSSNLPPSKPPEDSLPPFGDNSGKYTFSSLDEAEVKQKQAVGEFQEIYSTHSEVKNGNQEFRDNVQNLKYKRVAWDIVNKIEIFFIWKEKYFKVELNKIDDLLKTGKYTESAQKVNKLMDFYGANPNLILRQVIVDIHQGGLRVEQVFPEKLNQSQSQRNFLDEINKQLENNQGDFKRVENDTQIIYGQDSPKFNNLDFKIPIEQSIPSGSGARVYKLIPGEIGKTKLHMSGLGDASASSHASTQFQGSQPANALRNIRIRYRSNAEDDQCQNKTEQEEQEKKGNLPSSQEPQEKPVYVVITADKA